jgi:hypothetical protein
LLSGVAAFGSQFAAFSSSLPTPDDLSHEDTHTPAPEVIGIDVSHEMCYYRTNVDTQLSK